MFILNPLRFRPYISGEGIKSGEVCFAVRQKYLHVFMLIKFRDLKEHIEIYECL